MSLFKRIGGDLRQIRDLITLRRDDELTLVVDEVTDAPLPGKSSKLQVRADRTVNRHR